MIILYEYIHTHYDDMYVIIVFVLTCNNIERTSVSHKCVHDVFNVVVKCICINPFRPLLFGLTVDTHAHYAVRVAAMRRLRCTRKM